MNREDYTTYSQAIRLKALGYDCECEYYYKLGNRNALYSDCGRHNHNKGDETLSAPSMAEAAKWLRAKDVHCEVHYSKLGDEYTATVNLRYVTYSTVYEVALSAAIDRALEVLEKGGAAKGVETANAVHIGEIKGDTKLFIANNTGVLNIGFEKGGSI